MAQNPDKRAVYAGSFNPFHAGHMDTLKKACALFGHVYVVVARNSAKLKPADPEAIAAGVNAQIAAEGLQNASAHAWDGYTFAFAKDHGAAYLVRGVRDEKDARQEILVASVNAELSPGLQTVLFVADRKHAKISSTAVREAMAEQARHFGDPQK